MDVARIRRRPQLSRAALSITACIVAIALGTWTLPRLFAHGSARGPVVPRDSLTIDTVTRGALERSVIGAGVLLPDRTHIVATVAEGIVSDVRVRPGTRVTVDTPIARLENPDLGALVADAAAQLVAARADVRSAREEAAGERLDRDMALRSARAEDARAAIESRADTDLHAQGLVGDLQYRSALIKSDEDHDLVALARSKIAAAAANDAAKIAAAQARVDQLAALLAARRAQLATLAIRSGAAGVVQSVAIDAGQRVASGAEIARVADDRDLKAVLQVAESDVRSVTPGMRARITTSDASTAAGRVSRVAPAAQNGTVAVDVALDRLPQGARAAQNVDGTIVIARFARVLSLARPNSAGDASRIALYRLDRGSTHAYRTSVQLASGSEERLRVISGLAAGDRVVVSDLSAFDAPVLRIQQ